MKTMRIQPIAVLALASLWTGCMEPAKEGADPMTPVVSKVLYIFEGFEDRPETTTALYTYDSRGYPVRAVDNDSFALEFDAKGRPVGGHSLGSDAYLYTFSWFGMDSVLAVFPPDPYAGNDEAQVRRAKLFGFLSEFWPLDWLADSVRVYNNDGAYAYTYMYPRDARRYPVAKIRIRNPQKPDTSEVYQNTYDSEGRLVAITVLEPAFDGLRISETMKLEYDVLKNVRASR